MNATIRCFLALAVLAVAGCSTTPREVKVPVAVRCEVDMPDAPSWATKTLTPESGIFEQVRALLSEREQRIGYEDELRSALEECADEIDIETGDDESADESALDE